MTTSFDFRIEWLEAPGVATPELAATWARYEVWVGDRCVTQVETADGTFRRGVYGALYPLAYWIASNWWLLASHVRPSAVDTRYWTWQNVGTFPWLRQHNFRGAGDGMAWPDLTLVPEGAVTRVVWSQEYRHRLAPVRFASDGSSIVRSSDFLTELATIVDHVLERLTDSGLPKTPLAEEWAEIAKADDEERSFCRTAARLGLDPYSVEDETADGIISIAAELPDEILDDFFDSADVTGLAGAAVWAHRALPAAGRAAVKATEPLDALYAAVSPKAVHGVAERDDERPWLLGYAMARQLRYALGVGDSAYFDVSPWVGIGDVHTPAYGIYGLATVTNDRCGVVLGNKGLGNTTRRFGQARALGRILARPEQQQFVLSAAHSHDESVARAFAAELLAPAAGIRHALETVDDTDDSALETVARRFRVSPLVVRHQYDNQITASSWKPLI